MGRLFLGFLHRKNKEMCVCNGLCLHLFLCLCIYYIYYNKYDFCWYILHKFLCPELLAFFTAFCFCLTVLIESLTECMIQIYLPICWAIVLHIKEFQNCRPTPLKETNLPTSTQCLCAIFSSFQSKHHFPK